MECISIEQKQFLRGSRTFATTTDGHIHCEYRHGASEDTYVIPLRELSPYPTRRKHTAWSAMVAAIAFGAAGIAFIANAIVDNSNEAMAVGTFFGGVCIIVSPICLRKYFNSSHDIVRFPNECGGIDVLLFRNRPSPHAYEAFVTSLQKAITEAKSTTADTHSPTPADQLTVLALLKDQRIITEDEFARMKDAIVGNSEKKGPIGF